jgi:hypothetical protein
LALFWCSRYSPVLVLAISWTRDRHGRAVPTVVEIEKRKWDGSVAVRDRGVLIESSDEMVAWLVPAGTTRERPRKHQVDTLPRTELWLAPRRRSWLVCARSTKDEDLDEMLVHACLPILVRPEKLEWIDLDLDLHRDADGTITLQDIDDFAARAESLGYSQEAIRAAWIGISDAAQRMARGGRPFDGTLERMLRAQASADSVAIAG